MQRQIASHPMDLLDDDVPVTVGMLRAATDEIGQGIGFVLGGALIETGMGPSQCRSIAQALHTLTANGTISGPAADALIGVIYGMDMFLQGSPQEVGKPTR